MSDDITNMLRDLSGGDRSTADRLLPLIYEELRALAGSHLRHERPDHTLQATALVHEAYLKMIDLQRVPWQSKAHFFAVAARAIRRILIDHACGNRRQRRGGKRGKLSLDEVATLSTSEANTDLLDLDQALTRLAGEHPEKARVVEMRFFGGLSTEDTAQVCGVSTRTVERHWEYARAWLYREMT